LLLLLCIQVVLKHGMGGRKEAGGEPIALYLLRDRR